MAPLTESKVPNPSAVLLNQRLAALRNAGRGEILVCIRTWFAAERQRIEKEFLTGGDAAAAIGAGADTADTLIQALFATAIGEKSVRLALVATGGYGRRELFPYSDIDILFLHDEKDRQQSERVAEYILYMLWDLGLTVGQSHRTPQETMEMARQDITIRTNLLDARFVAGDAAFFASFLQSFQEELIQASPLLFIDGKLAERDQRHQRFGDSRYVLEPNIKEGKGGLRDLQTLWWLARASYPIEDVKDLVKMHLLTREEYRAFDRARQFLWRVRAHLHILAGRAEERLTFDKQHALARLMGYAHKDPNRAVERFMRRYFSVVNMVGAATRVFCALLEEEKKRKPRRPLGWFSLSPWKLGHFKLAGERLNVKTDLAFEQQPGLMIDIFRMAQQHELDIHPRALQLMSRHLRRINRSVQQDSRINATFLDILLSDTAAETTLRRMSEAGVLGRFIPEFGRVVGQTQFNMFHVYTVDEHTLVAIGILHAIENGERREELPLASEVIQQISMRRVLYVSLLCHDIAKGRGGDHSELGEKIVLRLARRFGFEEAEVSMAAWLVKYHLLFSNTAFKRDLDDPKTIHDFVSSVQSPERLKLLFLLTVADMRAVSGSIWNAWKADLLRELYKRAMQAMGSEETSLKKQESDALKRYLQKNLRGVTEDQIDQYFDHAPSGFLSAIPAPDHAVIFRMLAQAAVMEFPVLIDTDHDYERSITRLMVCARDEKGVFSRLAGAMSLAGANIISARIFTLKNGMVIDVFQIQDAGGDVFDRPDRLAKVSVYIEQALSGELDLAQAFTDRRKKHGRRTASIHRAIGRVSIENNASNLYSVIEISGPDRVGLLYQATQALAANGLSIVTAHILTYGTQIADVFYVKDGFGMKVQHPAKIEAIRESLLAVISSQELS